MKNIYGKYILLGNKLCIIVPSTLNNLDYVSLLTLDNKYIRHANGAVVADSYQDSELFKHDSSFKVVINDDNVKLYCSNLGMLNHLITYSHSLIVVPEEQYFNQTNRFKIIDPNTNDITLNCLERITHLENNLERLIALFNLHNPITNVPKAFGKVRAFQERGIELLKFFSAVCKKHNLSYWIDYGTLLGAVRHKGYIPWDDDLDICMMSDDFYKFQNIIDSELSGTDIKYTHNFYPYIYKLERTTLGDEDAWLDIFPFYFQKEDVEIDSYISDFQKSRIKRESLLDMPDELRKFSLEFNEKYDNKNHSEIIFRGFQAADHPLCDVRNYNDVFPLVEIEFEGLKLFAPQNYMQKLQNQYGNFWQYPNTLLSHREW